MKKQRIGMAFVVFMLALMTGLGSSAQTVRNLQIAVYDSNGKVAYEGLTPNHTGTLYPFSSGIEVPNPNGTGTLKIPFDLAVECSFLRVDRQSLTPLDLAKIQELTMGVDEHLKQFPYRVEYVLADRKQHVGTSGLGEGVKVSVEQPDGTRLEIKIQDFGKLVIKRK